MLISRVLWLQRPTDLQLDEDLEGFRDSERKKNKSAVVAVVLR